MNHEGESSHAGRLHPGRADSDGEDGPAIDGQEEARQRVQQSKERRLDAKRKRITFLDHLLRQLDSLVFVELLTIYYLDCSFFWFLVRSLLHVTTLTPLPDLQLAHQNDQHKAYLPLVLFSFAANFFLHLFCKAPAAIEEVRGYLHGGLMMDFIGQQGPTAKWKLAALDVCVLLLQLVMVSVTVKRRVLKEKLAKSSGGTPNASPSATEQPSSHVPASDRDQDVDAEERGALRRTDTLSDVGADIDADEDDALLATSRSDSAPTDALELLSSGQCVIGRFSLIDTLLQEHADYQVYRQTRSEVAAGSTIGSDTLRPLHQMRANFWMGGG